MTNKNLIISIMLMAAAVGVVNVLVMPPFMNPDEIQHFLFSGGYAYDEGRLEQLDGSPDGDPAAKKIPPGLPGQGRDCTAVGAHTATFNAPGERETQR